MRTVEALRHQREHHIDNNAYKFIQCDFAYNSNHIEGSTLTHDQTILIYERNMIQGLARVDDINEARNHFKLFDFALDHADDSFSEALIKQMHGILKSNTSAVDDPYQTVGDYKLFENEIAGAVSRVKTASVSVVPKKMNALIEDMNRWEPTEGKELAELAKFHWRFESMHPFSDGNGRIGRMLMFMQCLQKDITPFVVTEDMRSFYIRGLREFEHEPGYLIDTLGYFQDRFSDNYLPLINDYIKTVNLINSSSVGDDDLGNYKDASDELGGNDSGDSHENGIEH